MPQVANPHGGTLITVSFSVTCENISEMCKKTAVQKLTPITLASSQLLACLPKWDDNVVYNNIILNIVMIW